MDFCAGQPTYKSDLTSAGLAAVDRIQKNAQMSNTTARFFHLHLISDATGETLTTIAKAVSVQYAQIKAIEHVHPLVRTQKQMERVLQKVADQPGIVLYTVVDANLKSSLEDGCRKLRVPSLYVLAPMMKIFESYLGAPQTPVVAGQRILDADYFRRIDALNFTIAHDDGRLPEDLDQADIIVIGISRTSKTPTSIYLAQRGYKTINVPLVPSTELPQQLESPHSAFVVGLVALPARIAEIRRNRVGILADTNLQDYVDRDRIAQEIRDTRRLCTRNNWPVIDVTRRSVEETAASIIKLFQEREAGRMEKEAGDND